MKNKFTKYKMNFIKSFLFALLFTLSFSNHIFSYDKYDSKALIVEIVDGEVFKAINYDLNGNISNIEYIKLIGIKTDADKRAYDYALENLLGKEVRLVKDKNLNMPNDKYSYYYLYLDNDIESYNSLLLSKGYAKLDVYFQPASLYSLFEHVAEQAKLEAKGIFEYEENDKKIININTASMDQLMKHFDIDKTKAKKWRETIMKNKINTLNELINLDKDYFNRYNIREYSRELHLVTDLNTADVYELESLFSNVANPYRYIEEIILARTYEPIKTKDDLKRTNLLYLNRLKYEKFLTYNEEYYRYYGN